METGTQMRFVRTCNSGLRHVNVIPSPSTYRYTNASESAAKQASTCFSVNSFFFFKKITKQGMYYLLARGINLHKNRYADTDADCGLRLQNSRLNGIFS